MADSPELKTFSFRGCDFVRTSPGVSSLTPDTQVLNIEIAFEDALKLNLAIDECIRKLNSYKRSTTKGKRTGLNLVIHLSKGRVTVNQAALPKPGHQEAPLNLPDPAGRAYACRGVPTVLVRAVPGIR